MGRYLKNEIVDAHVTGIENYGIFVSLDECYSGLIHISEISDDFVNDVSKFVTIGEHIKVKVIESDDDNFKVKLSIKNLNYRCENANLVGIKETPNGFTNLKNNLLLWINDKQNEKKQKTL